MTMTTTPALNVPDAPYVVELDQPGGVPIRSNTPAWLVRRQTGIGASDAPAILGLSPWSSPRDVYLSKLAETISDDQTEAMEFGHEMERVARAVYKRRHGLVRAGTHRYLGTIRRSPGLLRSIEFPHLLASPDALIVEPDGQTVSGQIKNVTAYKRSSWAEADGGVPDDVRVQVIQEGIVLGADHGWVIPIFGGNHMPEPIRIDTDPAFVDWYTAESATWWAEHVEARVEPAPTLLDDLSEIWGGVMGTEVSLPPELAEKALQHKALGAQIKAMETQRDSLALDVKSFMGDATEAWDRTGPKPRLAATWRPHREPREVFHRDELLADHPELEDLLAAYTRRDGATPRPFLSK